LKRQNRDTAGATYLHAEVGKHTCDCLLGTGSEVTIIPASVVEDEVVKPSNHKSTAANGTEITVLGEVTLPISVGDYSGTVSGLVSEHVVEVMLGVDWMEDNAIAWEFHRSRIKTGQKYYGLKRHSNVGSWCRRVFLQTDVIIPSRSEVDLPTLVVMRRLTDKINVHDVEWGTEPGSVVPGVHTSCTLIPGDRLVNIPVRVMNMPCEDVVMKAGTKVADLQPVTILGKVPETGSRGPETTALNVADSGEGFPQFIQELIDCVHDSLPESTRISLAGILRSRADVFSESEKDLGLTDVVMHNIDTAGAKPVRQQLRRHPPAHRNVISQQVDDYLKQGVIEPAFGPWASNLVLVRKKDGSYRCCVDYRALHSVTRKDEYPLARIDSCLDALASAKWFSTFDLRSAYHHVKVNTLYADKTAFICPKGMFKFRRMPFGLCNAGATFQRLMDIAMSSLHF